jgi:hypothetical protein
MIPRHSWRSWRQPLTLASFGSAYNALTLEPWHVPALLIDPAGTWLNQISTPGPQIITGMRGCGKTMLLRALQFHARASQARGESAEAVVGRISADGYMGLFVSAQRLSTDRSPARLGPPIRSPVWSWRTRWKRYARSCICGTSAPPMQTIGLTR